MNFEVLCRRGTSGYLIKRENDYCMVNVVGGRFSAHEDPGVFLKLGYFEDVNQADPQVVERIAQIISDPANQVSL